MHFPTVRQPVSVGVPVNRTRAKRKLLKISKTVVIGITSINVNRLRQRIKKPLDLLRRDNDGTTWIVLVVTTADQLHELTVNELANMCMIPKKILKPVGKKVAVGISLSRIGRTLRRPTGIIRAVL